MTIHEIFIDQSTVKNNDEIEELDCRVISCSES